MPGTRLRGVPPPLTDGAAAGTWRGETDASGLHGVDVAVGLAPLTDGATGGTWSGETDASGLHGGDLAVGLARLLLQSVPMGCLTQPGGEVRWSKPVRAKSKG